MSAVSNSAISFVPYQLEEAEEYMNEAQEQHFKQILESWKAQLLQEANLMLDGMRRSRESFADEVDLAAHEENFRLELRAKDRERKLLKKIEQSLLAIKTGDYGFCDTCGLEIGVLRLEARPTAEKCIECKTVSELKEKQLLDA